MKFLLIVILLAAAIYFTVRVIQRRGILPDRRPDERRPLGPDDDPDFLRDLDRKWRRRKPKPEDPDPSSS